MQQLLHWIRGTSRSLLCSHHTWIRNVQTDNWYLASPSRWCYLETWKMSFRIVWMIILRYFENNVSIFQLFTQMPNIFFRIRHTRSYDYRTPTDIERVSLPRNCAYGYSTGPRCSFFQLSTQMPKKFVRINDTRPYDYRTPTDIKRL